jgi:hypothetical protein
MKRPYVSKYFRDNSQTNTPKNMYVSPLLSSYTKKGLNQYFSFNDENYDTSNEVQLVKELQQEQIRMYGYMVTYIVRTNHTLDKIYGESIGSNFEHSFRIEAMPDTPELMIGRDAIMPYGYAMTDTVTLHISFDRLRDEIKKLGIKDRTVPMAGDLIAFDIPGNIREIRYVEDKNIPYAKGTWTMYTLSCQVFNKGQETFDTGDAEIDFLNEFEKTYEYPHSENEAFVEEARPDVKNEPNAWNLDFNKAFKY